MQLVQLVSNPSHVTQFPSHDKHLPSTKEISKK